MDELVAWVREDFGLRVVEVSPVSHGADVAAEVWKVEAGGRSYAVKWSGGGTDAGTLTVAYLVGAGVRGVPEPVRTIGGELWSWRGGRRLTMQRWVVGVRAADTGLTADQWTEYGRLLREVHTLEPVPPLLEVLPGISPVSARMPELARRLQQRLLTNQPVDQRVKGGEMAADRLHEELAAVWREHAQVIDDLISLAERLQPNPGQSVICHADPHLGNVLTNADGVYLVDWDDAVLAPVEQDLMFMLGGMGSLGPTTQEQLDAFFDGYGPVEVDQERLRYYRCVRALDDVALWSEQVLVGPDREEALGILRDVLAPAGLVAHAVRG